MFRLFRRAAHPPWSLGYLGLCIHLCTSRREYRGRGRGRYAQQDDVSSKYEYQGPNPGTRGRGRGRGRGARNEHYTVVDATNDYGEQEYPQARGRGRGRGRARETSSELYGRYQEHPVGRGRRGGRGGGESTHNRGEGYGWSRTSDATEYRDEHHTSSSSAGASGAPHDFWICSRCELHNGASRESCYGCGKRLEVEMP